MASRRTRRPRLSHPPYDASLPNPPPPPSEIIDLAHADRATMEVLMLEHPDLWARFDEARLLAGGYTDEEVRTEITRWVAAGNEREGAR